MGPLFLKYHTNGSLHECYYVVLVILDLQHIFQHNCFDPTAHVCTYIQENICCGNGGTNMNILVCFTKKSGFNFVLL